LLLSGETFALAGAADRGDRGKVWQRIGHLACWLGGPDPEHYAETAGRQQTFPPSAPQRQ